MPKPATDQTTVAADISRPQNAGSQGTAPVQIQLEPSLLEDVTNWAVGQVDVAKQARSELEVKLNTLTRIYEAKPESERKDFPWPGACNLVVPVAATAVETVFARITGGLFAAHDIYAGIARSSNWGPAAQPVTDWLNWVSENVYDAVKVFSRQILSCLKYGSAIIKVPWRTKVRQVNYKDASGGTTTELVTLHDGPDPEFIPLIDFFWSPDADSTQDIQNCEWIAQRFRLTWKQIKEMELSGDYIDVDRLTGQVRGQFSEAEIEAQARTGYQPQSPNDYELFELWGSYPVDDAGTLAELVVTFHLETKTVLSAVYNFYRHQERPFHIARFFLREIGLLGIGLVEMLRDVQDEVTAIHRTRIDNATLANMKVFARTSGANVTFGDMFPGAILDVEDKDDLTPMDLGNEHSTLLYEEQHTITIGEKRSGVSDYSVGRESSAIGSRATATSTMALLREGARKFEFFIREERTVITNVGHQVVSLYQQFAPQREVHYELFSQEEAKWFQQVMNLPPELSRSNIILDVKALDETNSEEMRQQAYMTMLQIVQETYIAIGNAMMVMFNQEAPEPIKQLAIQGAKAASELIKRLLESFGFKDAESFAPNIDQLLAATAALETVGVTNNAYTNAAGGPEGAGGPPNQQGVAPTGGPSKSPPTNPSRPAPQPGQPTS